MGSLDIKNTLHENMATRRLKSFPWDALVYGSIMAFYLNLEKLGNRKDVSCYEHRRVGYLYGLV